MKRNQALYKHRKPEANTFLTTGLVLKEGLFSLEKNKPAVRTKPAIKTVEFQEAARLLEPL